jgi:Kae1-associated kinase Bud32
MKLVGEGAEASIYEAKFLGEKVLLKKRIKKEYRAKELDERIRRERTKKEAKILSSLFLAGVNCPELRFCDLSEFSIFFTKVNGRLARNSMLKKSFFEKAGVQLALIHNTGVTHGDFTTSNLIISKNKVYVIDFGLSNFSKLIEEQATDLLLFRKSVSEKNFKTFASAYSKAKKNASKVIEKMNEIEKRGRYVVRMMT